jgi:flagellar hook-length control protein FliK
MFAQLLPDANRVPTSRQEPAHSPKRADGAKPGMRAENRQASRSEDQQASKSQELKSQETQESPAPQSKANSAKAAHQGNPAESEDNAAEPVVAQAEITSTTDTTTAVAGLTTPVTPPADPAPAADATPSVNATATDVPAPGTDIEAAEQGSGTPGSTPPATTAQNPAPLASPVEDTPPTVGEEVSKPAPQAQTGSTPEPELVAGDAPPADVPSTKATEAAPTETPDEPPPEIRAGRPTGSAPETPAPTVEDREPGNSTIDAPKIAEPTPENPELGKPGAAADARAGKPGNGTDPDDRPLVSPEDAPQGQPRDNLVRLGKVEPQTGTATDDAVDEPADAEAGKPLVGEPEAKGNKSATTHETATPHEDGEPAAAHKPHPHAEFRSLIADPANIEFRATDVRAAQTVDLTTASIPSMLPAHTAAPAAPTPAQTALTPPVPIEGLAVAMATNAKSGTNRFEIRLDPPELGRIDVRLHIDSKGHVTSHLIVDRAETLDLLRRDAADLERSLQQTGLKTSDNGMQFSLRDQSHNANRNDDGQAPTTFVVVPDTEPATNIAMRGYTRAGEGAGLDIRV